MAYKRVKKELLDRKKIYMDNFKRWLHQLSKCCYKRIKSKTLITKYKTINSLTVKVLLLQPFNCMNIFYNYSNVFYKGSNVSTTAIMYSTTAIMFSTTVVMYSTTVVMYSTTTVMYSTTVVMYQQLQ